jgi:hypothetical protein
MANNDEKPPDDELYPAWMNEVDTAWRAFRDALKEAFGPELERLTRFLLWLSGGDRWQQ